MGEVSVWSEAIRAPSILRLIPSAVALARMYSCQPGKLISQVPKVPGLPATARTTLDRYRVFNKVADWALLTNGNTPNFYAYDTRAFEVT